MHGLIVYASTFPRVSVVTVHITIYCTAIMPYAKCFCALTAQYIDTLQKLCLCSMLHPVWWHIAAFCFINTV